MIPSAALRDDWADIDRVVFRDAALAAGGTEEPQAVADTLQERGGYRIVDRLELAEWLAARRSTAGGTILVNPQGDSIPLEGLEDYVRAGGRLVWCGAMAGLFGLVLRQYPPERRTPPKATAEGVKWGFRPGGRGGNGYAATESAGVMLAGVGDWASIFFLNLDPSKPASGLLKIANHFNGIGSSGQDLDELMSAAAHGIGEPFARLPAELAEAPRSAEGPGELVATGSFLVARDVALRKLSAFRFAGPSSCLLPWARAATASGATLVEAAARVGWRGASLEASFDGKPLAPRWVRDPFSSLFIDDADSLAAREVALCLLALLQLAPKKGAQGGAGVRASRRVFPALREPFLARVPRRYCAAASAAKLSTWSSTIR